MGHLLLMLLLKASLLLVSWKIQFFTIKYPPKKNQHEIDKNFARVVGNASNLCHNFSLLAASIRTSISIQFYSELKMEKILQLKNEFTSDCRIPQSNAF